MDFLEEFKSHKRYVFDKAIYIEYMLSIGIEYSGNDLGEELWTTKCDNSFVKVDGPRLGVIQINEATYEIMPEWCREVPSIRILTENDL